RITASALRTFTEPGATAVGCAGGVVTGVGAGGGPSGSGLGAGGGPDSAAGSVSDIGVLLPLTRPARADATFYRCLKQPAVAAAMPASWLEAGADGAVVAGVSRTWSSGGATPSTESSGVNAVTANEISPGRNLHSGRWPALLVRASVAWTSAPLS